MAGEFLQGYSRRVYYARKTTWDTFDGDLNSNFTRIRHSDYKMSTKSPEFRPTKDTAGNRATINAQISGRHGICSWSVTTSIRPEVSGEPAYGDLLRNGFGTRTSTTYTIAANQDDSISLAAGYVNGGTGSSAAFLEHAFNSRVSSIMWEWGDTEPQVTFTGIAPRRIAIGVTESDSVDNSTDPVTITVEDADVYDTEDVGDLSAYANGEGIRLNLESETVAIDSTGIVYASDQVTATRAQEGTSIAAHAAGTAIYPSAPGTSMSSAEPVPETGVTISIGGSAFKCISGKVNFDTGKDLSPYETGSKYAGKSSGTDKPYTINGELGILFRADGTAGTNPHKFIREIVSHAQQTLSIVFTNSTGDTMTLDTNSNSDVDFSCDGFDVPDEDVFILPLNFKVKSTNFRCVYAT